MKKFNKKTIEKAIRDNYFDPNELGSMKVIMEIDNANYYELRAAELIMEAGVDMEKCIETPDIGIYNDRIKLAIQLLIMAKLKRNG